MSFGLLAGLLHVASDRGKPGEDAENDNDWSEDHGVHCDCEMVDCGGRSPRLFRSVGRFDYLSAVSAWKRALPVNAKGDNAPTIVPSSGGDGLSLRAATLAAEGFAVMGESEHRVRSRHRVWVTNELVCESQGPGLCRHGTLL